MKPAEGRRRVVIEEVQPQVDCGLVPARRFLGDRVAVSAAIFCDGHDHVAARLLWKHQSDSGWQSTPMTALPNDLWSASFIVDKLGPWSFTLQAWVDHFDTWCADLKKRLTAQPDPATQESPANTILVVVNLDPRYEQSGWVDLDLKQLGIAHDETFDLEDLLTGIHYQWHDRSNFVVLSPSATAHIFRLTRTRPE
jgi:hypothetical protein